MSSSTTSPSNPSTKGFLLIMKFSWYLIDIIFQWRKNFSKQQRNLWTNKIFFKQVFEAATWLHWDTHASSPTGKEEGQQASWSSLPWPSRGIRIYKGRSAENIWNLKDPLGPLREILCSKAKAKGKLGHLCTGMTANCSDTIGVKVWFP